MLNRSHTDRIIVGPHACKLFQMMRAQDGPILREVVEILHDDGDEKVEDQEGTDHVEGEEVNVREVTTTPLLRVIVTSHWGGGKAWQHYVLPVLPCCDSEKKEKGHRERLEVVEPEMVEILSEYFRLKSVLRGLPSNHI